MIDPLFVLDGPQYHEVVPGQRHAFRGVLLALEGDPFTAVELVRDGDVFARGAIDLPSVELAAIATPGASTCRFALDATLDERAFEIRGSTARGETQTLFHFDLPAQELSRMRRVSEGVFALPPPPPEIVATTQGVTNVDSYVHSAVSGLFTLRTILRQCGHDPDSIIAVLDVGCGTGRSLIGWHVDGSRRQLTGADINPDLIRWAASELGAVARWQVSNVTPPLDLPDAGFDLIQLASVFTHLPLPHQRAWLVELRRLLRPGGSVVISLHGEIYVRLMLDPAAREAFERAGGYAEFAAAEPGANAFSTFHSRPFAESLFRETFADVHWFPRGNLIGRPSLFPFASLQDVYVLK